MPLTHNSVLADNEPPWSSIDKSALPPIAFAVVDDPKVKGTRHAPHHWISGDTMYLHRGGLIAAKAAVQGARTGKMPPWRAKAIPHINKHLAAIGLDRVEMAWTAETATNILSSIENERLDDERALAIIRYHVGLQPPVFNAAALNDDELVVEWTRFTEGWQEAIDKRGAGCRCASILFQSAYEVYEEAWLRGKQDSLGGNLVPLFSEMPAFDKSAEEVAADEEMGRLRKFYIDFEESGVSYPSPWLGVLPPFTPDAYPDGAKIIRVSYDINTPEPVKTTLTTTADGAGSE